MRLLDFTPPYAPAAVEVNAGLVRLVSVADGKPFPRWETFETRQLPAGAVRPGPSDLNIAEIGPVREALRAVLEASGYRGRSVSLLLSDAVCRPAILDFETLPASRRLAMDLVRFRLKKTLPFPVEEARLSVSTLPAAKGRRVLAVAAREQVIAQYEELLEELRLTVGLVDVSTLNLVDLLRHERKNAGRAEPYMVVNADWGCFSVAIIGNEGLVFYRTKPTVAAGEARVAAELLAKDVKLCLLYYIDRLGGGELADVYLRVASGHDERLAAEVLAATNAASLQSVDPLALVAVGDVLHTDRTSVEGVAPLVGMVTARRWA